MLLKSPAACIFAVPLLAIPLKIGPKTSIMKLMKRSTPVIDVGLDREDTKHIKDAFEDAITIAKSVLTSDAKTFNSIYAKYFDVKEKATVFEVFEDITGGKSAHHSCNSTLSHITVIKDFEGPDYGYHCDEKLSTAELIEYDTSTPRLILCDYALRDGGIDKAYRGDHAVTCDSIGDTGCF